MAESKVFQLMNGVNAEILCGALEGHLRSKYQMVVQSGKTTGGYVVQGKQEADAWKRLSGTDLAITVQLFESPEIINITIGYGKWSDKIGAGIIAWFLFWPLAVTAGIGASRQKKLPAELFDFIERFILSGGQSAQIGLDGGRFLSSTEVLCKKCKTANAKGTKFCVQCGSSLIEKCSNCGADISGASNFCPECGTAINNA